MTWKVESITEADIEDLHELFSNAGPYVSARTLSDYWLYARLFSTTCLCIRDDTGKPIAAVIAFRDQAEDSNEIYIQDVAVSSTLGRRGLGGALLEELRHRSMAWGTQRLWLTSEPTNDRALQLWSKLGYRNEQADYVQDGLWVTKDLKGIGRDRVVYSLRLQHGACHQVETTLDAAAIADDPGRLDQCLSDDFVDVRIEVANNTENTQLLVRLATDEVEAVSEAAMDRIADQSVIAELTHDPNPSVRYLALNRLADRKHLYRLAEDEDPLVREELARHPRGLAFSSVLAEDEDHHVRLAVARHTEQPEILATLATDDFYEVRLEVARRDGLPESTISQLVTDRSAVVRLEALSRLTDRQLLGQLQSHPDPNVSSDIAKRLSELVSSESGP